MFKRIKRMMLYGFLSSLVATPVGYFVGYNKGILDNAIQHKNSSKLERIAENKYSVINPDDFKKYEIDFENKTVILYGFEKYKKRRLEEIFE